MAMITNYKDIKGVQFYKCFSQRMSHVIQNKLNVCPIDIYTHPNGKIVNVFIMTPELSEFLKKWTENKPNKEVQK